MPTSMGTDSRMPPTLRNWETTRQLGKRRYVVRNGVIGWGIPVGIILTLLDTWRRGFSAHAVVIAAIIWPIAGYFVGLTTWAIRERRYQQLKGQAKTEA